MSSSIDVRCDYTMVKHLLRLWANNSLRPQGVRLAKERPRLIAMQNGFCPRCNKALVNDGKQTHLDHIHPVKEFADRIMTGELTFEQAYIQLWADTNLWAVHSKCNYARNKSVR